MERTYIMIKPDGVQRNLVGEIIARFEKKGYKLAALKVGTTAAYSWSVILLHSSTSICCCLFFTPAQHESPAVVTHLAHAVLRGKER